MQKRDDNKDQKKNSPAFTRLFRHFRYSRYIPAKTRPTISPDIQLLYISRLTSYAPTRTSQSLITAHRANLMNSSSDNPKTLVNSRKRSHTLIHHTDEKSASVGIAAKRKRAGWNQKHLHKVPHN